MDTVALPFRDLAYVVIAAITGGLIAWRLRQPVIIGYVLAGVAISPLCGRSTASRSFQSGGLRASFW